MLSPADESSLGPRSRAFAAALFAKIPALRPDAHAEPSGVDSEHNLVVNARAPNPSAVIDLYVWMENGIEPSVGFGAWHTHAGLFSDRDDAGDAAIVDLLKAILSDQFVLVFDVGGPHDGHCGVLDLREHDALVEELTSRYSPGRARVVSWTGGADRTVGVEDL